MRRSSIIAVSTLASLVLLVAPASAQSPALVPIGSSAWVIAGDVCSVSKPGTDVVVGDLEQLRGAEVVCNFNSDDPRVNGRGTGTYDRDCTPVGCVYWGTTTIDGPDGQWVGSNNGIIDPNSDSYGSRVLTGTGAYAGLTFVSRAVALHSGTGGTVTGLIYQGPPPPAMDLPSAPSSPAASPAG